MRGRAPPIEAISRPRTLGEAVPVGVHNALNLAFAFEASKRLSLVSAIEFVWAASY